MKQILVMMAAVVLVGCGGKEGAARTGENNSTTANSQPDDSSSPVAGRELTPAERRLVGTYVHEQEVIRLAPWKKNDKIVLLDNGILEVSSTNSEDRRTFEKMHGKWRLVGKELHFFRDGEDTLVSRINTNSSLTFIADINKRGVRSKFHGTISTMIKVKPQVNAKTLQWTFGAGGRDIAAWKGQSAQSVVNAFGKPDIAKPYGQDGGAWTYTGMNITDVQGKQHAAVTFIILNGAVAEVQLNTP
ncbi:MAG: hypothetical protein QF685_04750 [Verrucomicrobiota bacterium]|nr:hypothetical protein [Verrucomicrobiota bacterium]